MINKNLKTILSLILIFVFAIANAQDDKCLSNQKEYEELLKLQKVTEAFTAWTEVRKNCPKLNESLYKDGVFILQYRIDNAKNQEEKEVLVRDLMKLYDQYNKYFPEKTADFEVRKAMVLYNNNIDAKGEIFGLLESAFSKASESISDATAIYIYFNEYFEKYSKMEKNVNAEVVLDKYSQVSSMLTELAESKPEKATEYNTALLGINALMKDVSTCDNLNNYYQKKFSSNKEDYNWLLTAVSTLSVNCSSQMLFYTLAQELYNLKATTRSSYFLALASLKQKRFDDAFRYYNESAELQSEAKEKARIYYTIGVGLLSDDKAKSKEYLNKALSHDPYMGRAYLFLGQMYANSAQECGVADFDKKAVYYLAIETFKKAGIVEPMLKAASDKMIKDYSSNSLTASEISKKKLNGRQYQIGCWINETLTFPAK